MLKAWGGKQLTGVRKGRSQKKILGHASSLRWEQQARRVQVRTKGAKNVKVRQWEMRKSSCGDSSAQKDRRW